MPDATETITGRPWLAELAARYGESRVPQMPVPLRGENGNYVRECWVWFPDGQNHNLAIDHYADHWVIRAGAPHTSVRVDYYRKAEPADAEIRAVLVLAGFLEGASVVDTFRVYADEDGDLELGCPQSEAVGCIFGAGFVTGATLGEMSAAAAKHTGAVAEEAHANLMRMQGDG